MQKRRRQTRREEAGAPLSRMPNERSWLTAACMCSPWMPRPGTLGTPNWGWLTVSQNGAQLPNTLFRRIAGDDGRVHRADRDAGDPIRMQVRLRKRLIDAGLIGAEGASALEDQRNALERRPLHGHMGLALRRWPTGMSDLSCDFQLQMASRMSPMSVGRDKMPKSCKVISGFSLRSEFEWCP